jgi:hypothetical protein
MGQILGSVKVHPWVITLGQQGTEPDLRIYAVVHRCERSDQRLFHGLKNISSTSGSALPERQIENLIGPYPCVLWPQRSGVVRVSDSGGMARARPLSSGVLWPSLVAACPTAATIAFLVLLPVATILATTATRRPEQRQADYPAKAQTQKPPATQGHSKNGIGSGCRFSCIRHRGSPYLARFVTILTARHLCLVPELPHDSQH